MSMNEKGMVINMDINKICPGCMQEVENRNSVGVCPHCKYDLTHIESDTHQLQPFTILSGKYLVGKVIGEGGFGITYLGFDLNLELIVAIKEFYPNGFVTREANHSSRVSLYSGKNEADVSKWREGFINEAKNLAKFSNLNGIVEVRDFFNENNTAYIVMEYIDGITLKQYLKQNGGKISVDKTLEMMEPVIRALSKVHDTGMIHRDISPDNIMITKHGGMKLLDFGAAREFAGNAEKSLSIMLKPGYAPEEQYRSRGKQGPWSDVYALTASIYKCITGVTPIESMERMREDSLRLPSELGIKITPQQESAIQQGMAVYAENRIQNMDMLYSMLYSQKNTVQNAPTPNTAGEKPASASQAAQQIEKKLSGAKEFIDKGKLLEAGKGLLGKNELLEKDSKFADKKLIAIGCVCCLALVIIILALIPKGGKKGGDIASTENAYTAAEEDSVSPEKETAEEEAAAEEDEEALSAMIDEINASIADSGDVTQLTAAMDSYLELADQYGANDVLSNNALEVCSAYEAILRENIDNCNSQEPRADLYLQMKGDIDSFMGYADSFAAYSIYVNADYMTALNDSILNDYKQRLVENFDSYAAAEMKNNGVVSRSELWSKVDGIRDTELYDTENPDDALRRRYATALTLHTDSELDKLAGEDVNKQIAAIYEVLSETDYNPLLVYYLAVVYDIPAAYEWYNTYRYMDYDIGALSNNDQKNFAYWYNTDPYYQNIRNNFVNYMSEQY